MTSTELIQEELARFLSTKDPEVLCVSGEWGVGKTFIWQAMLDKAKQKRMLGLMRYAYVSLFGIGSLESLKFTMFENSEFLLPEGADNLLAKSKKSGNWFLGLMQKTTPVANELPYVGGIIKSAGPLFFSLVRNQIVCIDDLERRSPDLPVKDVLGLVSFLKEQRKCKVILLLNDKEFDGVGEEEFRSYFEKVVDIAVKFTPTPEDAVRIALPGTDKASQLIGEHCKALQISNIRIIKKIERFVRIAEPLVAMFDERVFRQAVQSLALLGWSKYQPGTAPSIDYLKYRNRSVGLPRKKDVSPEQESWNALLDAYGFVGMDEFDVVLLKGVENGFFDPGEVEMRGAELDRKIKAQEQSGDFESAWRAYHESFADNESEVVDAIYSSFKKNVQVISPVNLNGAIDLLKELGSERQADELLRFYMDTREEGRNFWDLSQYTFADHVTNPGVVKAFNDKLQTFRVEINPVEVLLKISTQNAWNEHELVALASLPSEEYYKIFKSHSGRELSRIISGALSFLRVVNASDEMKDISRKAKDALTLIGKESKINALRVKRFGIRINEDAAISALVSPVGPSSD
ncbi:hypothetical protein [Cystobacter fuscus]|uniref:hypothetical protein n=1 Tax=Cystobacter fuscus TaxID=43 RepID=UPI002B3000B5|nr:hypothetical protein F0U63_29200 [Cystobacter fuscus]